MSSWRLADDETWAAIDALEGQIQRFLGGELTADGLRPLRAGTGWPALSVRLRGRLHLDDECRRLRGKTTYHRKQGPLA